MSMLVVNRPPQQYLAVKNTSFCLISNEYDKNTYAECNYVAGRTLIRCRQVRKKEDLAKNAGNCEQHVLFRDAIKRRYAKEKLRNMDEASFKRRKYNPVCRIENDVSDEDDSLKPCNEWRNPFPDRLYENAPDDNVDFPLRNAGVYTEKELVQAQMRLINMEIKQLELLREMQRETINRAVDATLVESHRKKKKKTTVDLAGKRVHQANMAYQNNDGEEKRLDFLESIEAREYIPPRRLCRHGQNISLEKDVETLMSDLLDHIGGKAEVTRAEAVVEQYCYSTALPGCDFCMKHVTGNAKQQIYRTCTECNTAIIDFGDDLCVAHRQKAQRNAVLASLKRNTISTPLNTPLSVQVPTHNPYMFGLKSGASTASSSMGSSKVGLSARPSIDSTNPPSSSSYVPPSSMTTHNYPSLSPIKPTNSPVKFTFINSDSEEEIARVNKELDEQIEEANIRMAAAASAAMSSGSSALANVPSVLQSLNRPIQSAAAARASIRRPTDDETMKCARIRPFTREFFPVKPKTQRKMIPVAPSMAAPRAMLSPAVRTSLPYNQANRKPSLPSSSTLPYGGRQPINSMNTSMSSAPYRPPPPQHKPLPQPPHRLLSLSQKEKPPQPEVLQAPARIPMRDQHTLRRSMLQTESEKAAESIAETDDLMEDRKTPTRTEQSQTGSGYFASARATQRPTTATALTPQQRPYQQPPQYPVKPLGSTGHRSLPMPTVGRGGVVPPNRMMHQGGMHHQGSSHSTSHSTTSTTNSTPTYRYLTAAEAMRSSHVTIPYGRPQVPFPSGQTISGGLRQTPAQAARTQKMRAPLPSQTPRPFPSTVADIKSFDLSSVKEMGQTPVGAVLKTMISQKNMERNRLDQDGAPPLYPPAPNLSPLGPDGSPSSDVDSAPPSITRMIPPTPPDRAKFIKEQSAKFPSILRNSAVSSAGKAPSQGPSSSSSTAPQLPRPAMFRKVDLNEIGSQIPVRTGTGPIPTQQMRNNRSMGMSGSTRAPSMPKIIPLEPLESDATSTTKNIPLDSNVKKMTSAPIPVLTSADRRETLRTRASIQKPAARGAATTQQRSQTRQVQSQVPMDMDPLSVLAAVSVTERAKEQAAAEAAKKKVEVEDEEEYEEEL